MYDDETLNAAFDAVIRREQLDPTDEDHAEYARGVALADLHDVEYAAAVARRAADRAARLQAIRDAARSSDYAAWSEQGAEVILLALEAHERAKVDAEWGPAPF